MPEATVYFVAGERSGDDHGAALLKALRARVPEMRFMGRGGPKMHALADGKFRDQVMQRCFEKGLLLLSCGESTLRFCPPLIVTPEEVVTAVEIFDTTMRDGAQQEAHRVPRFLLRAITPRG